MLWKKKIGCKRWMTVSPAYNLFYLFRSLSSVQLTNAEMFTSISVQVERQKTPAGQKTGSTFREIYRTAGQLSRREKNATLAFTSNPISPGSE